MLILIEMDHFEEHQQPDEEEWQPLFSEHEKRLDRRQAELFALVLDARSIPCYIDAAGAERRLFVPKQHLESARNEIRLYEEKNRDWPPPLPAARALIENTLPTVSVLILLATFHNLTLLDIPLPGRGVVDLHDLGASYGVAIRAGQWWRLVTSLTLHADFVHLLGNLTIGGSVIVLLCRELGSGLGWSLLLGAGVLGNLANAWVQSPDHRSLGASTAVFGAIGVFSAISMLRRRHQLLKGLFIPMGAGLALLALLGTEGKQTDLGAHLFGFFFGLVLGLITDFWLGGHVRPGRLLSAVLALVSAAVVMTAWWLALTVPGS